MKEKMFLIIFITTILLIGAVVILFYKKNKTKIIKQIVTELLDDKYYQEILEVFNQEFKIDISKNHDLAKDINAYKENLTSRIVAYLNQIYSYNELLEMSNKEDSRFWYKIDNPEYKKIIKEETSKFFLKIKAKLDAIK